MLYATLPISRKPREPSPTRQSSDDAGPASSATESPSTPPPPTPGGHRFYSSMDSSTQAPSNNTPETSCNEQADTNEDEDPQVALEDTRQSALQTLSLCRSVIATLEITRLRKSRSGLCYWLAFWEHLYERRFARLLAPRVSATLNRIDDLFRTVSTDLHELTNRMTIAITLASSEKEILHILEHMEDEVGQRRRRRRKRAQILLYKMRASIEAIPVKISDELFDDMKRGLFALDVYCDYHPGDPVAEAHESSWSTAFYGAQYMGAAARYQQEGERDAYAHGAVPADAWTPLGAYTANNAWV